MIIPNNSGRRAICAAIVHKYYKQARTGRRHRHIIGKLTTVLSGKYSCQGLTGIGGAHEGLPHQKGLHAFTAH